jgi:hypothetical protein
MNLQYEDESMKEIVYSIVEELVQKNVVLHVLLNLNLLPMENNSNYLLEEYHLKLNNFDFEMVLYRQDNFYIQDLNMYEHANVL